MAEAKHILGHLSAGTPLSEKEAEAFFEEVLSGGVGDDDLASALTVIAKRPGGPTVDEIVGGAKVMRKFVTRVPLPEVAAGKPRPVVIDTCGTGGAPKTFNVSTVAAFVVAAAAPGRVWVAKHGSLSRTGRGSAEVLEKLGVNVAAGPEVQSRCLAEVGVCFCFAVHHHPAMRHAAAVRKRLGFPTIFNLLGPLTNPAGAMRQLMGTYSAALAEKMAEVHSRLGTERAMVVTSRDGLDELTTTDVNLVWHVRGGKIEREEIDAAELGLARARLEELQVGTLDEAAAVIRDVLAGRTGRALDMALLNAAGALVVAGTADGMARGIEMARGAIESGAVRSALEEMIRLTRG